MKKIVLMLSFIALCFASSHASDALLFSSPNGQVSVRITLSDGIHYDVLRKGQALLTNNVAALSLTDGRTLGSQPKLSGKKVRKVTATVEPIVPLKFSSIANVFTEVRLTMKGGYAIEFRLYDDAVAYRFITALKGQIEVKDETMTLGFPQDYEIETQPSAFKDSYEGPYKNVTASEWSASDRISTLPILIDAKENGKVFVCEADQRDYPGMFIRGTGRQGVTATFPKVPLKERDLNDKDSKIEEEAPYIAKTDGTRAFPWRYFLLATSDGAIVENTMSAKLSSPSLLADTKWIAPGQVSWDWWNGVSVYGPDVQFRSGINTATYKYFIDFAAKYNIAYILIDEGWAADNNDFKYKPEVDIPEIVRYGNEKNVGVLLWLPWVTVKNHFDDIKTLASLGIKGLKVDFMNRSDQWMVRFYERVAAEAARYHLHMDFHGAFKPAGMEFLYPNILSHEGVRGMEQMGGCYPDNSVFLPFMRNAAGPMDYTPGAMLSMQPECYISKRPNSASIGTRAYQMALYVIFESGIQMLSDSPTHYYANPDCTDFITSVPVTWDETRSLQAEAGQYLIVAKRKGHRWFIGGFTGSKRGGHQTEISLDFLSAGRTYRITSFEDGINADHQAMDYTKKTTDVKKGDKIKVNMARNGGFAAVIE